MNIKETLSITKSGSNYVISKNDNRVIVTSSDSYYNDVVAMYDYLRGKALSERATALTAYLEFVEDSVGKTLAELVGEALANAENVAPTVTLTAEEVLERGLGNLLDFFKEFNFTPSFRFVNTLSRLNCKDKTSACDYVANYFSLMDSSYKNDVVHKVQSKEFGGVLEDIGAVAPTHVVNERFKLYYGTQGTGKTTIAMKETDNRCIVCNSSMLPSDLMEDFVFVDGKATFKPSSLWRCMEEGKSIVLDEINLLPFDSLRFLQGILDGKTEFEYKGQTVHVNSGFQIIGTMNLTVNGMTYGLPEPLIDRCSDIREFTLTASMLKGAVM